MKLAFWLFAFWKKLNITYLNSIVMNYKSVNWLNLLGIGGYHVMLAVALPFYFIYSSVHLKTVLVSFILIFITGISITAGYHRFYAHKAYKLNKYVEAIILFFGTMTMEGSALKWSFQHRMHHTYVDKEQDPYNITKGFWHAHIL